MDEFRSSGREYMLLTTGQFLLPPVYGIYKSVTMLPNPVEELGIVRKPSPPTP